MLVIHSLISVVLSLIAGLCAHHFRCDDKYIYIYIYIQKIYENIIIIHYIFLMIARICFGTCTSAVAKTTRGPIVKQHASVYVACVVEPVHASIARSSARSLRIWLPGDSSADYHLDSISIGAKIIVLLVIFTYIIQLYNIYISLYIIIDHFI